MKFLSVIKAVLREVFDEAAYERFRIRDKSGISRESYARFLEEADRVREHKARCC